MSSHPSRSIVACIALGAAQLASLFACSRQEEENPQPVSRASAQSVPSVAARPSAAPSVAPTPRALRADCPEGSSGEGSYQNPCEAKGTSRMMEVAWTRKIDDKGPYFRVVSKANSAILYGKMAVYFYDKAGQQLEVGSAGGAKRPYHTCGGNMFGGVMKPGEKAVFTFSCVRKEDVPEGTATIEAEMQMVGFADATESKNEYYWRNLELTPDHRPKGGMAKSGSKGHRS